MAKQTIKDVYPDGQVFEDLLTDAGNNLQSNWEEEFVNKVWKSWDEYGVHAFLSDYTLTTLKRIAGWDNPNEK